MAAAGVEGGGAPLPFLPKDILRLDALPLESREVLLLTVVAGLPYGQVAEVLDVDGAEVFARLTRARDLLAGWSARRAGASGRQAERARGGPSHLRLVK